MEKWVRRNLVFDRLKPRFLSKSGAGMRNVERNRNLNFVQLATHFTVAGEAAEQFLLKTCVRIHGKYLLHKLGWGRGAEWWAALWCASGLRELTADAVEQLAVLRHHQKQILLHNIIPPKVLRIESIYVLCGSLPGTRGSSGKIRSALREPDFCRTHPSHGRGAALQNTSSQQYLLIRKF